MASSLLPHEQAHVDLIEARQRTVIDVPRLRAFLYGKPYIADGIPHPKYLKSLRVEGSEEEWKQHESVVKVLAADPTFDKSRRYAIFHHVHGFVFFVFDMSNHLDPSCHASNATRTF